ncbi:hypothetical protein BC829DRAFT_448963 [Chytridium lagenaria]|nr:hypothetical protein BC829DRAFT_448963 [Chytridium lagenaria]
MVIIAAVITSEGLNDHWDDTCVSRVITDCWLNNAATAAVASRRSKTRSTFVAGSGLDALLISAVAETGEVHGTLALEVGAVACDLEEMAALAAKKVRLEVVGRVREEEMRLDSLLENFPIASQ